MTEAKEKILACHAKSVRIQTTICGLGHHGLRFSRERAGGQYEFAFEFVSTRFFLPEKMLFAVKWSIIKLNYLMINLGMHIFKSSIFVKSQLVLHTAHEMRRRKKVPWNIAIKPKTELENFSTHWRSRNVFSSESFGHALQLSLNTIAVPASSMSVYSTLAIRRIFGMRWRRRQYWLYTTYNCVDCFEVGKCQRMKSILLDKISIEFGLKVVHFRN